MKKIPFAACFGFSVKPFIIFVLVMLLLIPLQFVKSLVRDRKQYRSEAVRSILEPLGGTPVVEGFAVLIPYIDVQKFESTDGTVSQKNVRRWITLFPESWEFTAEIVPSKLTRGIFEVPVFSCEAFSKGAFKISVPAAAKTNASALLYDEALFCLGISNKKNMMALPEVFIDETALALSGETPKTPLFSSALFYALPAEYVRSGFSFSAYQKLQGGECLSVRPVAAENTFSISSSWSSPGFSGGWLPVDRNISAKGFTAKWEIPGFSTNFPEVIYDNENTYAREDIHYVPTVKGSVDAISVSFVTPVDNYQKTMRSVKYAVLFLIIPFVALFVLEIFTGMKIHPVQYAVIGLADVIFYLLLLAVSEHLPFPAAYWLSAVVVSFLTLFYAAAVFRCKKWGAVFAAVQSILYVFLFGTLQTEDYALLIGAFGLLGIVSLLMMLTRNIEWYPRETEISEK